MRPLGLDEQGNRDVSRQKRAIFTGILLLSILSTCLWKLLVWWLDKHQKCDWSNDLYTALNSIIVSRDPSQSPPPSPVQSGLPPRIKDFLNLPWTCLISIANYVPSSDEKTHTLNSQRARQMYRQLALLREREEWERRNRPSASGRVDWLGSRMRFRARAQGSSVRVAFPGAGCGPNFKIIASRREVCRYIINSERFRDVMRTMPRNEARGGDFCCSFVRDETLSTFVCNSWKAVRSWFDTLTSEISKWSLIIFQECSTRMETLFKLLRNWNIDLNEIYFRTFEVEPLSSFSH